MKNIVFVFLIFFASIVYGQEITAFGTSFTYGNDVARSETFSFRLEELLKSKGHNLKVYNFGYSGDTTIDLINRSYRIPKESKIIIFEYARSNDHSRGISLEQSEKNAALIMSKLLKDGKKIILILKNQDEERLKNLTIRWLPYIEENNISFITVHLKKNLLIPSQYGDHPNSILHQDIAEKLALKIESLKW